MVTLAIALMSLAAGLGSAFRPTAGFSSAGAQGVNLAALQQVLGEAARWGGDQVTRALPTENPHMHSVLPEPPAEPAEFADAAAPASLAEPLAEAAPGAKESDERTGVIADVLLQGKRTSAPQLVARPLAATSLPAAAPAPLQTVPASAPAVSSASLGVPVDRLRLPSAAAASPPLPQGTSTFDSTMSLRKRSCVGEGDRNKEIVWDVACGDEKGKTNADFHVLEAEETFELLRKGASIFRFGDGELRLMSGSEQINHGMEVGSKDLRLWLHAAASMGGVARRGAPCVGLVGMMDGKAERFSPSSGIRKWTAGEGARRYQKVIRQCFPRGRYCSASITRPDHLAGWDEDRLVAAWASIFAEKVVLYIRPRGMFSSSHAGLFGRARAVIAPDFIEEARRSFSLRSKIMKRIHEELRSTRIDMVALSLGPTASVIAAELACQGVQAFDFGSWTRRR